MAKKRVKVEEFGSAIFDIMSQYQDEVTGDVKSITQDVAEKTAQKVRDNITAAGIGGTKYKNSISVRVKKGKLYSVSTIYSPKHYQLTHLLENGHKIVLWGHRTDRMSRAFPHWKPAEEWGISEMEKEIKEAVAK